MRANNIVSKTFKVVLSLGLLASCAKELPKEEISLAKKTNDIEIKSFKTKSKKHVMLKTASGQDLSNIWLYKVTVVKNSGNGGFGFVGLQSDAKPGYFKFTEKKLKFVSASELHIGPSTSERIHNQWDVSYVDYKLSESGGKVQNREVEDGDKLWHQKRFVRISFDNAAVAEFQPSSCYSKLASHVVNDSVQNEAHYKSWVVNVDYQISRNCVDSLRRYMDGDMTYTVQYRYSFRKLEKNPGFPKTRYAENDPLDKHFGFFKTYHGYLNKETHRRENEILMNKWDPRKEHNYYFTKNFPQKYKEMFHDIFKKTNKVFADAGLKVRFHARENTYGNGKVKELGDLRYSFINVVEENDSSAPLGYGPSDSNPFTGELISGNIHVWTYAFRFYIELIREEYKNNNEIYESTLFTKMKDFLGNNEPSTWKRELSHTKGEKYTTQSVFQNMLREKTFGYPVWNPFTYKAPQSNFTQDKMLKKYLKKAQEIRHFEELEDSNELTRMTDDIKHGMKLQELIQQRGIKGHCQTSVEDAVSAATKSVIDGKDIEDIIYTSIYTTSIHELGHTLNLRHNFYGSIDKENIKSVVTEEPSENGGTVIKERPGRTSSVMDYMGLMDEVHANHDWGDYDKAALLYAYSNGDIISEKKFMFCTDEHRVLNAMCNTWDHGTTPTQIVMNIIENYERTFSRRNFRFNRAFWDTRSYTGRIFRTMYDIKRFLIFWRSVYADHHIDKYLSDKSLSEERKTEIKTEIRAEFFEAIKLSLAFYNAVLQQSSAERPWRTVFSDRPGAVEQIGIIDDKVYAAIFMLGDDSFAYNPSAQMSYASYMAYGDEVELKNFVDKAMQNNVVSRVDMDIWFLGFVRSIYANNASNAYNEDTKGLLDKLKIRKFSPMDFRDLFGIDVTNGERVVKSHKLTQSLDLDYSIGDEIGYVFFEGSYYMIKNSESEYAYAALSDISSDLDDGNIISSIKDFVELYRIYQRNND
ncbi:MAG: zinc-dependent metalloprotease [Bacteriovoracaceae bacterium]